MRKSLDASIGVFAAADESYVPYAAMALRSFQRWFPSWGYFLAGKRASMSPQSLDLLDRFEIELLDIDASQRFIRHEDYRKRYPVEIFNYLLVPEVLANRGITYSIGIDGDVFCARPFDFQCVFRNIEGFGGRPVGTLRRALLYRERKYPGGEVFAFERVRDVLGIDEDLLDTRFEVNAGVVFWNNQAMARVGLSEKATTVFAECEGRVHCDQTLLTLTAASHRLPFTELDATYNFCFSESFRESPELRRKLRRGECQDICIVHFAFAKPWRTTVTQSAIKAHFINSWRIFVVEELGDHAVDFFEDLSVVRARYPIGPFWNMVRRLRSVVAGE
jgi:hypothetical protein